MREGVDVEIVKISFMNKYLTGNNTITIRLYLRRKIMYLITQYFSITDYNDFLIMSGTVIMFNFKIINPIHNYIRNHYKIYIPYVIKILNRGIYI